MASQKQRGGRSGSEGYVLLVFSLFAALLVIGVYRILPAYRFQGQRMKEEELIFRGQEYRRAIQLFVRKFGRYPTSLEELENTNEIRFIRKLYPDPMTEDGQWRLVHIGPDGVLYDSVHVTKPAGSSSDSEREERTEPDPFGPSGNAEGRDESGEEPATRANASPGTNPGMQPRASGALQQPRLFGGGGIAGVASKNEGEAIKVFNNYKHYNEWEFVFDISTDRIAQDTVKRLFGGGQPTPGSGGAG
ncbi:MAG TPA: hypothetical protein VNN17_11110, partial [Terriglobia bacterium]|nr:hypothetical protein [Terriglobia bacterium]